MTEPAAAPQHPGPVPVPPGPVPPGTAPATPGPVPPGATGPGAVAPGPVPQPPGAASRTPCAPPASGASPSPYAPPVPSGAPPYGAAQHRMPASPYGAPASPHDASASPYGAPASPYGAPASPSGAFASPSGGPASLNGAPAHPERAQPYRAAPGAHAPGTGSVPVHPAQPSYAPGTEHGPSRRGRRQGRRLGAGAVVGVVVLGLLAGSVGAVGTTVLLDARRGPGGGTTVVEVPGTPSGGTTVRAPDSLAGVAAAVLPSVVSLEVRGQQGVATGSGFVYSADGYIITNNHVVADAADENAITVTFSDGSESDGTVVGRTEGYDLAVVKVGRTGLAPLTLGDSEAVVVGDPVIAIGAPLGLEGTVTTGIVSALNRPVTAGDLGSTSWINALQTDAAINPGNSGGPLVNLAGEVVGVNSAIAQAPGAGQSAAGSIGLGFAIPANQVRRTAQQLIETGRATRPIIGALIDSRYDGEGVRVVRQEDVPAGEHAVTPGGPADTAGIRSGDIIVAVDGRPVTQEDELLVAIRALAPGDVVVLTLREEGGDRDVTVVLDEADAD